MTKQEALDLLGIYKDQLADYKGLVQELRKEKVDLQAQVERLQDGILSIKAPEAYQDYRNDMAPDLTEDQKTALQRDKQESILISKKLSIMEDPMFKDAGDMIELLGSSLVKEHVGETGKSLHDNAES
jgi:hypothetical protein